jgi:hypothetical protein
MKLDRRPHYWPADSLHLFSKADGSFYLQLANQNILRRMKSLRSGAQGYEKYLPHYPTTLCEPLDLFYLFRRAACTLDEDLLQDYLFSYGWREANWGSWLASLSPNKAYIKHLQNRKPTLPNGSVVIELAIASCGAGSAPAGLTEHWALLSDLRGLTSEIPRIVSPLRLAPTIDEEKMLNTEIESVRDSYKYGSVTSAKAKMQQPYLSYYSRPHLRWAKESQHQTIVQHDE